MVAEHLDNGGRAPTSSCRDSPRMRSSRIPSQGTEKSEQHAVTATWKLVAPTCKHSIVNNLVLVNQLLGPSSQSFGMLLQGCRICSQQHADGAAMAFPNCTGSPDGQHAYSLLTPQIQAPDSCEMWTNPHESFINSNVGWSRKALKGF